MGKRALWGFTLLLAAGLVASAAAQECVTIQDGTLVNSAGELLETGYDFWGYNYQGHMFNGMYCDAYRDAGWCQPWADVELMMKWNDAWLSNQDCTDDGLLDRYYGHDAYIGSGAWLTNHMSGTYYPEGSNRKCRWTYFVKIIAVPSDAILASGVWFDATGDEIGPAIWGSFAIIQQVDNDPCAGYAGLAYKGTRPGFGNWEDPEDVDEIVDN